MGKYIYKITNLLNGKIYIGQANNAKRRFTEHCRPSAAIHSKSLIDLAIIKYGKENFSFEVLGFFEDYNQKEKDYIKIYNSLAPNGYNILEGGNEPPVLKGESNPSSLITLDRAKQIQKALLDYKKPLKHIIKELNVSRDIVRHINEGDTWRDENLTYPIRPLESELQKIRVQEVKRLLKETSISQKEIAQKFDFKRSFVTMINIGQNWYDENEKYPLRITNKEKAKSIKEMLLTTNMSKKQIAKVNNVCLQFVENISRGRTWHDNNLKYPLRNFCNDYPTGSKMVTDTPFETKEDQ